MKEKPQGLTLGEPVQRAQRQPARQWRTAAEPERVQTALERTALERTALERTPPEWVQKASPAAVEPLKDAPGGLPVKPVKQTKEAPHEALRNGLLPEGALPEPRKQLFQEEPEAA